MTLTFVMGRPDHANSQQNYRPRGRPDEEVDLLRDEAGASGSDHLSFDDTEPFVFAFVVMRPRPAARQTDIEKSRELLAGLFGVEQHDYCVAKRMQRAA